MNAQQVFAELEAALANAKVRQLGTVTIESLEAFIREMRDIHVADHSDKLSPGLDAKLEKYRLDGMRWLDAMRNAEETHRESVRSTNEAGRNAIRSLVLINGGAAVALLAFLGHLMTESTQTILVEPIARAMSYFVWGVFAGGASGALTYLSQFAFAGDWDRSGNTVNVLAILAGVTSLTLFALGGHTAFRFFVPQ